VHRVPSLHTGVPDLYGRSAWVASNYVKPAPDWQRRPSVGPVTLRRGFPDERKTIAEEIHAALAVKKVCASCPVVRECLEAGFQDQYSMEFGIWGGATPRERQAVVNREDRLEALLAELQRQVAVRAA
jgi:hypothetical protein